MKDNSLGKRALFLIAVLALIFVVFQGLVRPWYLRWGATDEETRKILPGDEIFPNAATQSTRAIMIRAEMAQVWPWIAQIGQDRGGFYSYDVLENIVGCEMPTIDYLRPDKQSWQVGDKMWMYPANKGGGIGFATLRSYTPGSALGFAARALGTSTDRPEDGSWSFVLEPVDPATTRLIVRGRVVPDRALSAVAFDRLVFEPAHFVMERRMMIGLKQLAEGGDRHRIQNHAQVVLWAVVFAVFAGSMIRALGRCWRRALLSMTLAAVTFQILTYAQPSLWIGIVLTGIVIAVAWRSKQPVTSLPLARPPFGRQINGCAAGPATATEDRA